MKRICSFLAGFGCLFAAAATLVAADLSGPTPPRFSVQHMDTNTAPGVDFFRYAAGQWVANNPIPADKSRWGGFDELAQFNWQALKAILESTAAKKHPHGSIEQKVGDFFASALDASAIDAAGLKPLQEDLTRVEGVQSPQDLARMIARMHNQSFGALFRSSVFADQKNSEVNALYASQGGMSLPSKEYYTADSFATVRTEFLAHAARLLELAGAEPPDAREQAQTVFEIEKALAAGAKTPVELRDRVANYNKMPAARLSEIVEAFPLALYLEERRLTGPAAAEIIVGQPKFFETLQAELNSRPLRDWKVYLRYHLLSGAAPYLSEPFEREHFRFYDTVLRGTPAMEPRWQKAARVVDGLLGEALGQLYVARYYPPEARARMNAMIENIQAVMRDRLQKLDWMTGPTREKALAKFDRFVARIGHPDTWRDYSAVTIQPGDFFGNVRNATEAEIRRTVAKLGQPVDKAEWGMSPPTVNAYFQPTANQIVFPAGILQPPFFDFTLDDAVNYGAIGAVIGHEITHGFDDQGRRYDADGNLADWWTAEDAENFQNRAVRLIDQYGDFTALPGLQVNGALSLGENIADLGGVSIALEALQRSLQGKERPKIDGFTPEQRFFLSWAQQWRTQFRDDAMRRQVAVGPHAPGMFRAIGPLTNMEEFFEAFAIREGDPLWRKPEDRVKIW